MRQAKIIERAKLANGLVCATNNAAIAAGFDDGFNAVHNAALSLQARTQRDLGKALGWFVGSSPAYGAPALAFVLYDASATDDDLELCRNQLNRESR